LATRNQTTARKLRGEKVLTEKTGTNIKSKFLLAWQFAAGLEQWELQGRPEGKH